MKRWIIIGVVIVLLAAAGRNIYAIFDGIDQEKLSYVSKLNYDFTARVDSVVQLKKGGGYLICKMTTGRWNTSTEDSLNRHLVNFKRIRFLHFRSDDKFLIIIGGVNKFKPLDSIVVNSSKDQFRIYRNSEKILNAKISLSTRHKVSFAFWIKD
jgi:hypothetical protein